MGSWGRNCRRSGGQLLVGICLAAWISLAAPAAGQSNRSFKAGEDIEVFYLNKWFPAEVVDQNRRGDVLAEFEFAGAPRRQAFRNAEVRFAFESGAMARARNWSDQSGQFSTRAALLRIDDDVVTLRKPDMQEIKVPIAKLSSGDQTFLKRLQKELGSAAAGQPELPPVEQFVREGATVSSAGFVQRQAIQPDPVPGYLTIQAGGVAFPTPDVFDRLGAVLPLGGADSWLLAAVESQRAGSHLPTRLLWASMKKQEIKGPQALLPDEIVLDYHPPSHRLLTCSLQSSKGTTEAALSLWEVLPTDKEAKHIVRWNATPDGRVNREPWGRLVNGDIVLQRWTDREYVAWDVPGKRLLYRLPQESFFAPLPNLSGGRRYLFLPEDKRVQVLEAATGQVLSVLPVEDGAAAIAVTDDGRRAAVLGRTTLTIWDLTDRSSEPERIQAEAIGSPFSGKISWIDDGHLMSESPFGTVLFSLQHKLALWNYQFDHEAVRESQGRRLREIIDGHLVYAASVRSGAQWGLAVGAVELPGPKVTEVTASLDPDTLMIVKPGTAVQLEVRAGADSQRVRAALEKIIAANGWKLSPSAPIAIVAEMKQGDAQQVTYQMMFGGGPSEQTVTIQPFISEVRISAGDKVAWTAATSSGVPPVLHLKEGESMQSGVNEWQRPDPGFFDRLVIPERILDPAKRLGIGRTRVTNRGLVPE